jgi:hypothetical protein
MNRQYGKLGYTREKSSIAAAASRCDSEYAVLPRTRPPRRVAGSRHSRLAPSRCSPSDAKKPQQLIRWVSAHGATTRGSLKKKA